MSNLKCPVVEEDLLLTEFTHVDTWINGLEVINCLLGELGIDNELTIGKEELGVALTDISLHGVF